jgi:predicted Zn-dependent protease
VLALAFGVGCHVAPPVPQVPAWTDPAASGADVADDERALWTTAEQSIAELDAGGLLLSDPKVSAYLADVLARVLPGPLPRGVPTPQVRVVRLVDRQAVALPNGAILVSTSYLAVLANEAQLAAVLGHELGHVLGRDNLIQTRYRALSTSTVERMRVARSLEEAADATGLALMRRAGYDPREMIATLELIEADDRASRGPVFAWESHPHVPDRLETLRDELGPVVGTEIAHHQERYEDAIADLLLVAAQQELGARRLGRARAAIDRHLRLRPQSGRGYLLLAEHARLTERGGRRSATARRHYERAVELAPDDPETVRALALLHYHEGDLERARPLFATYLRIAPRAPDRKLIERYLAGASEAVPTSVR